VTQRWHWRTSVRPAAPGSRPVLALCGLFAGFGHLVAKNSHGVLQDLYAFQRFERRLIRHFGPIPGLLAIYSPLAVATPSQR